MPAHGHARPNRIPLAGWWAILRRVWSGMNADNLGLVAAGVAFYALLALFPGIAALMALGGMVVDPELIAAEMQELGEMMPDQAANIVLGQVEQVAGAPDKGLGWAALAGLGITLFSASKGAANLMAGLNVAYGENEKRGFFALKFWTLAMTVLVILGMIVAVLFSVALPAIIEFLPLPGQLAALTAYLRWPAMFLMFVGGISLMYRFGPSREAAKWRWITPGALAACALWLAGSAAFGLYVKNFASYNETFGALGGVVILLMWLWLSAFIILLGAKLDAETEKHTTRDSATGAPRPGGAVAADTGAEEP